MKIVVYTAIIGDIDKLWSVVPGHGDVEHIAFTSENKREVGLWGDEPPRLVSTDVTAAPGWGWSQRFVENEWGARRTARHYKTLPHRYMSDADVWIWVDGNVRLRTHPQRVVERYLHEDMATLRHPDRNCVYQEVQVCIHYNKDAKEGLNAQADRYRGDGFPTHWGLASTRAVIRRNTEQIRELNEAWWHEIENGSVRDQVALPYVCWKHGIRWEELPGECGVGNKSENWYYIGHVND